MMMMKKIMKMKKKIKKMNKLCRGGGLERWTSFWHLAHAQTHGTHTKNPILGLVWQVSKVEDREYILSRIEEEGGGPVFPIYLGDDVSDEDASDDGASATVELPSSVTEGADGSQQVVLAALSSTPSSEYGISSPVYVSAAQKPSQIICQRRPP